MWCDGGIGNNHAGSVPFTCPDRNSPMFLDVTVGHWLTMYRNRFPDGAPPLEMRLMTKERRAGIELADDVPNYSGRSGKFMLKLLAAWMAMGFRRPEIAWGRNTPGQQ